MKPLTEENFSVQMLIADCVRVYIRPGFNTMYDTDNLVNIAAGIRVGKILTGKWGIVVGKDTIDGEDLLDVRFPWLRESLVISGKVVSQEQINDGAEDWYVKPEDLSLTPWTKPLDTNQKLKLQQAIQSIKNIASEA